MVFGGGASVAPIATVVLLPRSLVTTCPSLRGVTYSSFGLSSVMGHHVIGLRISVTTFSIADGLAAASSLMQVAIANASS